MRFRNLLKRSRLELRAAQARKRYWLMKQADSHISPYEVDREAWCEAEERIVEAQKVIDDRKVDIKELTR